MHDPKQYPTQDQLINDIVFSQEIVTLFPTRIIVAGSRNYRRYDIFKTYLDEYVKKIEGAFIFYSGMAHSGADKFIVRYCNDHGYKYCPFHANWDSLGKGAGYLRNVHMAETATHLLAFWDNQSRGTKHMIEIAKERKLAVEVVDTSTHQNRIEIYTTRINKRYKINKTPIKFIDATWMTGIKVFAPLEKWTRDLKSRYIDEEMYTELYVKKMKASQLNPDERKYWEKLKEFDSMAIACYCYEGAFCHRVILANLIKEFLEGEGIGAVLAGEYS